MHTLKGVLCMKIFDDMKIRDLRKEIQSLEHDNAIDEAILSVCVESSSIATLSDRMKERKERIANISSEIKAIKDKYEREEFEE
jgi:predicted  nucleic acid-binding Zn-ribbon protein